jgi:prepilin-type N-terminal cleavage/methylation domain-containing protein
MKLTNNKGFTLIELIMVIVILGILSAVVVPKFFDFTSKAHDANKDAVIGSIKTGLNMYATNELMDEGTRQFPEGGTLSWSDIVDETPDDWSIVNNSGGSVDTIKYSGDDTKWVYATGTDEKTYTLTKQ